MASTESVAIRIEEAQKRIDKAVDTLTELFGMTPVNWEEGKSKYPEVSPALYMELVAANFEEMAQKAQAKMDTLVTQRDEARQVHLDYKAEVKANGGAPPTPATTPTTAKDSMSEANARAAEQLKKGGK